MAVLRAKREELHRYYPNISWLVISQKKHLENSTLKPILKYRKIGKTSEEAAFKQPKKEETPKTGPAATLGGTREGKAPSFF